MSEEDQKPNDLQEPSVLDYVKSLFRFRWGPAIEIPFEEEILVEPEVEESQSPNIRPEQSQVPSPQIQTPFPWRSLLAVVLAWIAQNMFEPPPTAAPLGVALYIAAFSALGWALYRGEWRLAPLASLQSSAGRAGIAPLAETTEGEGTDPLTYRGRALVVSVVLGFWAFMIFNDDLFTTGNVIVWLFAIATFLWAFWLNQTSILSGLRNIAKAFKRDAWTINISRWTILLIAAMALVFFFRFYQTASVPPEPFSDHAEKMFDVYDITQGLTKVFFTRNTGREGFQMYWTLIIAKIFGTGLSYMSLKLGTAILGFLTLPFVYLLGKEIGGRRVGLFAFILTGIGYWPNVISRVGLRFPLYPLFVAPTLFFLIRGLRTRNRNDFLLSGLFLGLGLHGYSPIRILPFVVVAAFVMYWLHSLRSQSNGVRRDLLLWLIMLALASLLVFLPLLRYWYDDPAAFGFRAFTRLSDVEQPLPGPIHEVFLSNVWNALRMFNYDDGDIWVHSVPHRPAFDAVSGELFLLGVLLILVRYIRERHWLDLFLLVSIPLLLMPSILSLAFPIENPALNRAGGAYIPAFLIAAIALDGLVTAFGVGTRRAVVAWSVTILLLLISASQNYDLVFRQYNNLFRQSSWNSSDMGKVISEFGRTYSGTDTAWVVPFPHWVDTRLPALWAGIPNRDMAMWREDMPSTVELKGPKLFIVKANIEDPDGNDQESLDVLQSLYPDGQLRMFDSDIPGHDFWIFFVPKE